MMQVLKPLLPELKRENSRGTKLPPPDPSLSFWAMKEQHFGLVESEMQGNSCEGGGKPEEPEQIVWASKSTERLGICD